MPWRMPGKAPRPAKYDLSGHLYVLFDSKKFLGRQVVRVPNVLGPSRPP